MPAEPFTKKDYATIVADLLGASSDALGGRAGLTDANAGSVVRTLMEAFARELALCYEQLDFVWRAGYIETAKGQALDNVVALLGIERQRGGYLVGAVEFSRSQPAEGEIAIPAGTLVAGRGQPPAETTREVVLHKGERAVRVDVRSVEPSADGKPIPAATLTLMPQPITGIEAVRNTLALVVRQQPETDEELQARTRSLMRRAHSGTKASIETAVRACGVSQVRVTDSADDPSVLPATVTVVVGDPGLEPDALTAIQAAVREARPAGVRVTVAKATTISIEVEATLMLSRSITPAEQEAVRKRALANLEAYFGQLSVGETVRRVKLCSLLSADDRVAEVTAEMVPRISSKDVRNDLQLNNGDVQLQPSQYAELKIGDGWPRLVVVQQGCRIDADLRIELTNVDASTEQNVRNTLTVEIEKFQSEIEQVRRLSGVRTLAQAEPPKLTYGRLRAAVQAQSPISASFTIVHEHRGRITVLAQEGDSDTLYDEEVPRLGRVQVSVSGASG